MSSELIPVPKRILTPAQYGDLADAPPELEWLANITNAKTRRPYKLDVSELVRCRLPVFGAGCRRCLRSIFASETSSPVIPRTASRGQWQITMKAALRLWVTYRRGDCSKPVTEDAQRVRDRAILAALLCHGIRREELCQLRGPALLGSVVIIEAHSGSTSFLIQYYRA